MLFLCQAVVSVLGVLISALGMFDLARRARLLAALRQNGTTWILITHDAVSEVVRAVLHFYIAGIAIWILSVIGLRPVPWGLWVTAVPPVLILFLSINSWVMRHRFDKRYEQHRPAPKTDIHHLPMED